MCDACFLCSAVWSDALRRWDESGENEVWCQCDGCERWCHESCARAACGPFGFPSLEQLSPCAPSIVQEPDLIWFCNTCAASTWCEWVGVSAPFRQASKPQATCQPAKRAKKVQPPPLAWADLPEDVLHAICLSLHFTDLLAVSTVSLCIGRYALGRLETLKRLWTALGFCYSQMTGCLADVDFIELTTNPSMCLILFEALHEGAFPHVTTLSLELLYPYRGIPRIDVLCDALAAGALPLLHTLVLTRWDLGDLTCVRRAIASRPAIRCFDLSHDGISGCSVAPLFEGLLASGAALQQLSLDHNELGDDGCACIAAFLARPAADQVMDLSLRCNNIGDAGVIRITSSICTGSLEAGQLLERINLSGNRLSSEGFAALCNAVKTMPSLCELDVSSNAIDDAGMVSLSDLIDSVRRFPFMSSLCIQDNSISDVGFDRLAAQLQMARAWASVIFPRGLLLQVGDEGLENDALHRHDGFLGVTLSR